LYDYHGRGFSVAQAALQRLFHGNHVKKARGPEGRFSTLWLFIWHKLIWWVTQNKLQYS